MMLTRYNRREFRRSLRQNPPEDVSKAAKLDLSESTAKKAVLREVKRRIRHGETWVPKSLAQSAGVDTRNARFERFVKKQVRRKATHLKNKRVADAIEATFIGSI